MVESYRDSPSDTKPPTRQDLGDILGLSKRAFS